MKRWAFFTVLLYVAALLLLTFPVVYLAFVRKNAFAQQASDIYFFWGYWLWLAILAGGQVLLLLVPIDISERRLPSRRKLKVPVILGTFLLANLFLAGLLSLLCAIFRENGFEIFDAQNFFIWISNALDHHPVQQLQTANQISVLSVAWPVLVSWVVWAFIFRRAARADDPNALVKRLTRWLLRGSILELLVAVPSHVIVRRRDDCCAPMGTFWGMATGISVMLLCFGPGVYFLFVDRFQRLKPKAKTTA